MKKQFLSLIVALIASISFVWGQTGMEHNSTGRTVSCTTGPLNPAAGVPYIYKASVTPGGGTYEWWATKDPNFITTPGVTNMSTTALTVTSTQLIAVSANYATVSSTTDEVSITWSDAILSNTVPVTNPTFVAIHYVGSGGVSDCTDNFKAFEITPVNAFVVDIKNIVDNTKAVLAYDVLTEQCPAGVASATYSGGSMRYHYGFDYFYYEVVASNFTNYWIPTFAVTGHHTAQTPVVEYTYANPSTWNTTPPTWSPVTNASTQFAVGSTVTSTQNGVSVYIRVTLNNNTYEGLALRPVTLTVDGQNSVGDWDVVNSTCNDPNAADLNDTAIQNILPRPTVLPVAPSTPFIPGNNQN